MMLYLIDTNIIVHYIRESETFEKVRREYNIFTPPNNTLISEVSIGEVYSLAKRNSWGEKRMERLRVFLSNLAVTPISYPDIYRAYAEIDTFSQQNPTGLSARNMGKNDLWIAATAKVLRATLVTTDKDFDHLQDLFRIESIQS